MQVEVRIPAMLRRLTDGAQAVTVSGETVRQVLDDLEERHQGILSELIADDGSIHRFVNIYLNDEDIRFLDKLDTEIKPGDTISILPAVAGGGRA
jgi:MoaD family protein